MGLAQLCAGLLLVSGPVSSISDSSSAGGGGAAPGLPAVAPASVSVPASAPAPTSAAAEASGAPGGVAVQAQRLPPIQWRNGSPVLVSADGGTSFRPLGQMIVDTTRTRGARDATRNSGDSDVRTAHLGFAGTVANHVFYQLETEFAAGRADILWAFVGLRGKLGSLVADVTAGNLQNDRGIEGSSGGEALPFAEANFVASAIAPDRGGFALGGQARLTGARWHASLAVTGNDIDARQPQSGNRTVLARAHWNPIKGPAATLHLGAWTFDEQFRGGTRTLGLGANVAHGLNGRTVLPSPALVGVTGDRGVGVEAGGVFGPFWVMGEAGRRTAALPRGEAQSAAKSLSAGWFVNGGVLPYAAATGGIGRPVVKRSVFQGGRGPVELTARYQELIVRTPGTRGTGSTLTAGVNWYLSSLMRVMANASAWRLNPAGLPGGTAARTDRGTTLVLRAQFVF